MRKYMFCNNCGKQGKYTLVPYQLEIACDYERFGKLLVELEKNERLITITEFSYNDTPENVRRTSDRTKLPDPLIAMEIATITLNKFKK